MLYAAMLIVLRRRSIVGICFSFWSWQCMGKCSPLAIVHMG